MSAGTPAASLAALDTARDAYDDATAVWRAALGQAIASGHSLDEIISHTGLSLEEIREELTFYYVGDPTPRLPEPVALWLEAAA